MEDMCVICFSALVSLEMVEIQEILFKWDILALLEVQVLYQLLFITLDQ